jgi:uncharacterized Ntn-hydrolase superfamily protein
VPLTPELRRELDERARTLGHRDFAAWVSAENYEMRVGDDWVDEKVLRILRETEVGEG